MGATASSPFIIPTLPVTGAAGPFTSTPMPERWVQPMSERRASQPVASKPVVSKPNDRRQSQPAYLERQAVDLGMLRGVGKDKDIPPELLGVSVRELVNALGKYVSSKVFFLSCCWFVCFAVINHLNFGY